MVAPRSPAPLGPAVRAAVFNVSGPRPCPPPSPPYSMAISSGSRSPLRGLLAVCWWVRDNPAPRGRARAQVTALATRGTEGLCLHACVRKIRQIWWIHRDRSQTFRTRAAEVSLRAVTGGFDRFLMTTWNVCQNPSCYKNALGSRRRQIEQGKFLPL